MSLLTAPTFSTGRNCSIDRNARCIRPAPGQLGFYSSHSHLRQLQRTFTAETGAQSLEEESNSSSAAENTTAAPSAAAAPAATTTHLVDSLLETISESSNGESISDDRRRQADDIIGQLGTLGKGSRPLTNELIYGNCIVAHVSAGNKQYGQPAGGGFRTGVGRFLFRTTRLCQSVIRPDIVSNKVELKLFGCLPCSVGLRGNLVSIPQEQGGENLEDTVKVFFDPPVLTLPGGIHTRIGPPSSVVLTTTYLDERVRLGVGSRGSLFVFTRGGEADLAGMEQVGLQKTSKLGAVMLTIAIAGLVMGGGYVAKAQGAPAMVKGAGVLAMLIGAALAGVFFRGGIMDRNPYDRPEVQKKEGVTDGVAA